MCPSSHRRERCLCLDRTLQSVTSAVAASTPLASRSQPEPDPLTGPLPVFGSDDATTVFTGTAGVTGTFRTNVTVVVASTLTVTVCSLSGLPSRSRRITGCPPACTSVNKTPEPLGSRMAIIRVEANAPNGWQSVSRHASTPSGRSLPSAISTRTITAPRAVGVSAGVLVVVGGTSVGVDGEVGGTSVAVTVAVGGISVGVSVGVAVEVGVFVGAGVAVLVAVGVCVDVAVGVAVGGSSVGVFVGVDVAVSVGVGGTAVAVAVDVEVGTAVDVCVGVLVGGTAVVDWVGVKVGVEV